jgi:hypothetical protein
VNLEFYIKKGNTNIVIILHDVDWVGDYEEPKSTFGDIF